MLHEFLTNERAAIIARAQAKVTQRAGPYASEAEIQNGVQLFLDQLVELLHRSAHGTEGMSINLGASATRDGGPLVGMGFSIGQGVHDYGDISDSVTELSEELRAKISADELRSLNRCVDDAIARAVTEFTRVREATRGGEENERLGALAHELRNKLNAANLAWSMIRSGQVGVTGTTAGVLERSLGGLGDLINRSLANARLEAGLKHIERIDVAGFVAALELEASLDARNRGVSLLVAPVPADLVVDGDGPILAAAVINVLQNACKFTRPKGRVSLTTTSTAEVVRFSIEDECGGLPPGTADTMFQPFQQPGLRGTPAPGSKPEGAGLGLTISRRGVEASGGNICVHDVPGKGCVFVIELPRVLFVRAGS